MMEGRKVVNDIPVLDAEYLIPFKMYAWLDLTSRKVRGEFVKEKTSEFLEKIKEESLSLDSIHAIHTKEDSIEILKAIYLSE